MANSQDNQGGSAVLGKYPITYGLAGLVLLALVFLAVMRHLTGTISVQVGSK